MGQNRRKVAKERLVALLRKEVHRAFRKQIRRELLSLVEPVFGQEDFILVLPQVFGIGRVGVLLIEIAKEMIEPAGVGNRSCARPAQSPLAEQCCFVASLLQRRCYGLFARWNSQLRLAVSSNRGVTGML